MIGAVLVAGGRAPVVVDEAMVRAMKPRSVIVDVAVDQGGCIETIRETSHDDPVYELHGVIHYAVGNMPGAVPHTSTYALTNATLPYILDVAAARRGGRGARATRRWRSASTPPPATSPTRRSPSSSASAVVHPLDGLAGCAESASQADSVCLAMRTTLDDLLALGRPILADGATGTNYFGMGLGPGEPPEMWNLDHPERVRELHEAFVAAGADMILTNTFGCNRYRLKLHGAADRAYEIARRAAELASRSPPPPTDRCWSPGRSGRPANCSSRSGR